MTNVKWVPTYTFRTAEQIEEKETLLSFKAQEVIYGSKIFTDEDGENARTPGLLDLRFDVVTPQGQLIEGMGIGHLYDINIIEQPPQCKEQGRTFEGGIELIMRADRTIGDNQAIGMITLQSFSALMRHVAKYWGITPQQFAITQSNQTNNRFFSGHRIYINGPHAALARRAGRFSGTQGNDQQRGRTQRNTRYKITLGEEFTSFQLPNNEPPTKWESPQQETMGDKPSLALLAAIVDGKQVRVSPDLHTEDAANFFSLMKEARQKPPEEAFFENLNQDDSGMTFNPADAAAALGVDSEDDRGEEEVGA